MRWVLHSWIEQRGPEQGPENKTLKAKGNITRKGGSEVQAAAVGCEGGVRNSRWIMGRGGSQEARAE